MTARVSAFGITVGLSLTFVLVLLVVLLLVCSIELEVGEDVCVLIRKACILT